VQDLADKGYVKGYPNGQFLGGRTLTRYEFATVIDRIVQTVTDLKNGQTPTGQPVTQEDLNKIQVLVDGFQKQLDTIQSQAATDKQAFQDQLDALRQDVLDTKAIANKAQDTANNSYGFGSNRKFQITGYIQARGVDVQSGDPKRYPQGTDNLSGAYNGNYAQGGTTDSLEVRRARLKIAGTLTPNSKYALQLDMSGATGTGTGQQVTTREAYVAYTFGDGDQKVYPTFTAGLFANPFGYILPASSASYLTPERPLAFSENGSIGLFNGQDYDKGIQIGYNTPQQLLFFPAGLKLTYALVNGGGRNSENLDRHLDSVYRVAYSSKGAAYNYNGKTSPLNLGVSYYDGQVERAAVAGRTTYQSPRKKLFGIDGQFTLPNGIFANAEYVDGIYESRTYFNGVGAPVVDAYVKNNHATGYYVQGGYTFNPQGNHPLTLAANYDKFLRSHSAQNDSGNALQAGTPFRPDATYDDVNLGYGVLYNLDKQTRLRFWYTHPIAVAHAPTVGVPPRVDLLTSEIQVKF
jgi:hypothetical protein